MLDQVWLLKRMNQDDGAEKVDGVYRTKAGAKRASLADKYREHFVWVDGPYALED